MERISKQTLALKISLIKQFYKYLHKKGLILIDPTERLDIRIKRESLGEPGIRAKRKRKRETIANIRGWLNICLIKSTGRRDSEEARVTIIPAAVETISAGI